MKKPVNVLTRVACLAVLGLLVAFPQAAQACGSACMLVSLDPFCLECRYIGGDNGSCVQYDTCGCYEIQCIGAKAEEELAASSLGFVPVDLEPAGECADAPAVSLGTD